MNQPARTFLLVSTVIGLLLALYFLPRITVGDVTLRRVNILSDLLPESSLADEGSVFDMPAPPSDSLLLTDSLAARDSIPAYQAPPGVTMIVDYGQPDMSGGMRHFYEQLLHIQEMHRPLRIAYYGDSFIEGDILTCDLREQLQTTYGGCGVGWVDCGSQVYGFRQTVRHSFSGIQEYEVVKKPFNTTVQGISERYFTVTDAAAHLQYRGSKARKHLNRWDTATFFFRTDTPLSITTNLNNDTLMTDTTDAGASLQMLHHRYAGMGRVAYSIAGATDHTYLYGVALEGSRGIIVDNYSMRGASGITLKGIPQQTLCEFAALRPCDLIILHYGLNVVSSDSPESVYKGYAQQMGQAIEHLRRAYPEASILVVSMSDRDQRTEDGIRTMRGVEMLVAHQQLMAAHHHVAFFNLFQAMGGRESMKQLVDQGMANKDYTHLSFAGGRRLARELVNSLNAGFDKYKTLHP